MPVLDAPKGLQAAPRDAGTQLCWMPQEHSCVPRCFLQSLRGGQRRDHLEPPDAEGCRFIADEDADLLVVTDDKDHWQVHVLGCDGAISLCIRREACER